jgi:hypothetical protein
MRHKDSASLMEDDMNCKLIVKWFYSQ